VTDHKTFFCEHADHTIRTMCDQLHVFLYCSLMDRVPRLACRQYVDGRTNDTRGQERTIKVRLLLMKRGDEGRMATAPWPSRTSLQQTGAVQPAYCSLRAPQTRRTSFNWLSVEQNTHIVTDSVIARLANTSASTAHWETIPTPVVF
jgi:hypothetical protein